VSCLGKPTNGGFVHALLLLEGVHAKQELDGKL
jgi:hypothetical protein